MQLFLKFWLYKTEKKIKNVSEKSFKAEPPYSVEGGISLTIGSLDLPPTSHYVFYIYLYPVAIYAEATLDGDIGLFLRKTNKSVPLSLSPFVRCLSLSCEGPLGLIP